MKFECTLKACFCTSLAGCLLLSIQCLTLCGVEWDLPLVLLSITNNTHFHDTVYKQLLFSNLDSLCLDLSLPPLDNPSFPLSLCSLCS